MVTDKSDGFDVLGNTGSLSGGRPVRSALTHTRTHAQVFYTDGEKGKSPEFVPTVTGSHLWTRAAVQDQVDRSTDAKERAFYAGLAEELRPRDGSGA